MYQKLGNTDIVLYDFFNNFSVFVLIIFNLCQVRYKKAFLGKYTQMIISKINVRKRSSVFANVTFWAVIETLIVSVFQFAPVMSLNVLFGNLVDTGTNYFGLCFLLPIVLMIAFLLLSINPFKQLDLITPTFALTLVTIKLACFCSGCCGGIECSWGLYNNSTKLVEFPVQLVEMSFAALIFIFLLLRRKKVKEGTVFPTYLILYSATRFFSEFLRSDPNIIWIFKKYHFLCIAGVIVGLAELYLVNNYHDRILLIFDSFSESVIQHSHKLALKIGIKKEKNIIHHKKRKK